MNHYLKLPYGKNFAENCPSVPLAFTIDQTPRRTLDEFSLPTFIFIVWREKKHGIDNRIYSASGLINTRLLEIILYAYTSSHLGLS